MGTLVAAVSFFFGYITKTQFGSMEKQPGQAVGREDGRVNLRQGRAVLGGKGNRFDQDTSRLLGTVLSVDGSLYTISMREGGSRIMLLGPNIAITRTVQQLLLISSPGRVS